MGNSFHHKEPWSRAMQTGGVVLMVLALLAATPVMTAQREGGEGSKEKKAMVIVKGMQCPFCAYGIKKHLAKLPGATRVDVELAKNEATITFEADAEVGEEEIEEAVRKAGFTAGEITWPSDDQVCQTSRGDR